MTSHNQPLAVNDILADLSPRANAMSIAWDEAARCLSDRDSAGFDAAMRIFRAVEQQSLRFKQPREAGSPNKQPVGNHGNAA